MSINTSINLLGQNRYKLLFSGDGSFIDNPFELMVTNVTMPGLSTGVTEASSPIRPIPFPGKTISFDELYVNFLISAELTEWIYIFNWIRQINFGSSIESSNRFAEAKLVLTTDKFNANLSFTFKHVFPTILSPLDLDTTITSKEVITSNASFRFADMILDN